MITYKLVLDKFRYKGYEDIELVFLVPLPPIFDPSMIQLQCRSREELYKDFDDIWGKPYRKRLEELSIQAYYTRHK